VDAIFIAISTVNGAVLGQHCWHATYILLQISLPKLFD